MAVTRNERQTKITLNVETAVDTFKNRIFNNINPALTDDKVGTIFGTSTTTADSLASLQKHSVNKLIRTDTATLVEG